MATECTIELKVNGASHTRTVEARRRLGDFLREDLGLTATHLPCEHGVCGVCTVIVDGKPRLSCLTLAAQVSGRSVDTLEGLNTHPVMRELQAAFRSCHALQCGFCTPGFLVALTCLFQRNADPSDGEVREVIDGVVCRCTGYLPILKAALSVRDALRPAAA